jgi:hypothetical protein
LPERVWQVLSDIAARPDWNSGVSKVEGTLMVGGEALDQH